MTDAHFILYVPDQRAATEFYEAVLGEGPVLAVPGMTQFRLNKGAVLGLMPDQAASRLLGRIIGHTEHPAAEIYLLVDDPAAFHLRALNAGATEVSALAVRDWGHEAAYSIDIAGHVLAFAREL